MVGVSDWMLFQKKNVRGEGVAFIQDLRVGIANGYNFLVMTENLLIYLGY